MSALRDCTSISSTLSAICRRAAFALADLCKNRKRLAKINLQLAPQRA
jgi:hypothetical protein